MQPSTLQNFSTAKDFHEEEERMKLRILQADAGLIGNKDLMVTAERMDWMYHNPVQSKQAQEDYLLGKPIQPVDEKQEMRKRLGAGATASSSLFINTVTANNEDTMRRLREDPLFLIQQAKYRQSRLACAREKILTTIQKPYGDKNEAKLYSTHDLVFSSSRNKKKKDVTDAEDSTSLSTDSHREIPYSSKISRRMEYSPDRNLVKERNTIAHHSHTISGRHQIVNDTLLSVNKKTWNKHWKNTSAHKRSKDKDYFSRQCLSDSNSSTQAYKNVSKRFTQKRTSSTFSREESHGCRNRTYRNRQKRYSRSLSLNRKGPSHKQRDRSHSACWNKHSDSQSLKRKKVSNTCKRLAKQTSCSVSNDRQQKSSDFRQNQRSPISHDYHHPLKDASFSPSCRRSSRYEKTCCSDSFSEMSHSNPMLDKIKNKNGNKGNLKSFIRRKRSISSSLAKKRYRHQGSVSCSRNSTGHSINLRKRNFSTSHEEYSRLSSSKTDRRSLEYNTYQRSTSRDSHNRLSRLPKHIKENVNHVKIPNCSHKLLSPVKLTRDSEFLINRQHHTSDAVVQKDQFTADVTPVNADQSAKHILESPLISYNNKQYSHSRKSEDSTQPFADVYGKTKKSVSSIGDNYFRVLKNRSSSNNSDYRSRKQDSTNEFSKKHRCKQYRGRKEDAINDISLERQNLRIYAEYNKSNNRAHAFNVEKPEINCRNDGKKIVQGPVCPSEWKGRLDAYSIDNKPTAEESAKNSDHNKSLETSSDSSSDLGPPQNFIETITSLRMKKLTVPHLVSRRSKQYNDMNRDSLFYEKNKKQILGHNTSQKNVICNSELELKQMMDDGLKHEQDKENKLKIIDSIDSIRETHVTKEKEKIWISETVPVFEKKLLVESTAKESKTLNERLQRYVARRKKTLLDRSELEDEQK